jgi:hypothetical protein
MKDLLISLRSVEERYKDKVFGVGELRIGDMAKECADAIEKLQAENTKLSAELEAAVKCISNNCPYIEFVEGGISYCAINGAGCDDCEHIWHKTKES